MLRELPVREVMVSDVLTFAPGDNVMDAMRTMLVRDVDGAPVVDADGSIVGLLSTADLIVEEARVHLQRSRNMCMRCQGLSRGRRKDIGAIRTARPCNHGKVQLLSS